MPDQRGTCIKALAVKQRAQPQGRDVIEDLRPAPDAGTSPVTGDRGGLCKFFAFCLNVAAFVSY